MFYSNPKKGFNYPFYKKGKQTFQSYFRSLELDKIETGLSIFTIFILFTFVFLFRFQNTTTNHNLVRRVQATAMLPSANSKVEKKSLFESFELSFSSKETKVSIIKPLVEEKEEVILVQPKLNQPKAKLLSNTESVYAITKPTVKIPKKVDEVIQVINKKNTTPEIAKTATLVKTTNFEIPKVETAKTTIQKAVAKKEELPEVTLDESAAETSKSTFAVNKSISEEYLPTSYFSAKLLAEQDEKLLIIKFGADWCLPCKRMDKSTFKDESVALFLKRNYVKLDIDVQDLDGVNMQNYFQVRTLPTLLVFNSKGKFVAKYESFLSAAQMLGILEKHHIAEKPQPRLVVEEKVEERRIPAALFNQVILQKNANGEPITSLKAKAKNWRNTYLNFSTEHVSTGKLKITLKETRSGKIISEQYLPVSSGERNTDTTTTDFQLDLSLKKRKKKKGTYVLEIQHIIENNSLLIGKITLIEGGNIIPLY